MENTLKPYSEVKKRRVIKSGLYIVVLCAVILTASCANGPRYYIALGDSVSTGYGLAAHEYRHSTLFFNLLKNEGYVDYYINMAVDGSTTTTLLEFLNSVDNDGLRIFRNARVITLNIGGNNILGAFVNYLSTLRIAPGAEIPRAGAGAEDIVLWAWGIVSDTLNIFSTFAGSFSPELRSRLNEAVQTFTDEFSEIISWLERNAPGAIIIVNTIYNPIPQEVLGASLEFSRAANLSIESMNEIIVKESASRTYLVTDIHSHLSNQLNLFKFNLNPFAGDLSLDIIHPNAEGHYLIARLNFATFTQR